MRRNLNFSNNNKFTLATDDIKKEDVYDSTLMGVSVSKREVQNKDFLRIKNTIKTLEECGKNSRRKLIIVFEYDDVPEEIYEIPEIREYVQELFKSYPYLLYFIKYDFFNNANMLMACLSNVEIIRIDNNCEIKFKITMEKNLYIHLFKSTAMYSLFTVEDTEENTEDILKTFRYIGTKED